MTDDAATRRLEELLAFAHSDGRVCPQPTQWKKLWELLPGGRRVGGSWDPPPPLILAAWHVSSDAAKRGRLAEHIRYAASHGVLSEVDAYLRGLGPLEWLHEHEC
jgi:hypothetical protein